MFSITSTIWSRLCGRSKRWTLETLPVDLLVDGVFAMLDLKDILTLRAVGVLES
jgi:hypothetical protein